MPTACRDLATSSVQTVRLASEPAGGRACGWMGVWVGRRVGGSPAGWGCPPADRRLSPRRVYATCALAQRIFFYGSTVWKDRSRRQWRGAGVLSTWPSFFLPAVRRRCRRRHHHRATLLFLLPSFRCSVRQKTCREEISRSFRERSLTPGQWCGEFETKPANGQIGRQTRWNGTGNTSRRLTV